jgi:hypothetical protein
VLCRKESTWICVDKAADAVVRGFVNVIGVWISDWMLSFLLWNKEISEVKHRTVAHIFTEASRFRPHGLWNFICCCQLKMSEHLQKAAGWLSVSHHYLLHLLAPAIFVLYSNVEKLVASGKKIFVIFLAERECLLIHLCLQQVHGETCEMPFCIIYKTTELCLWT